jgi:hypothetical protein
VRVRNRIADCVRVNDSRHRTHEERLISRGALHRCSFQDRDAPLGIVNEMLDAVQMAARFAVTDQYAPGYYTKGMLPYTFICRPSGIIEQLLPVTAIEAHAMRWNVQAVSLCCIGDFRKHKPTTAQWAAATEFCAVWRDYGIVFWGHDELPGASVDPNKECPGAKWNMRKFRSGVYATRGKISKEAARLKLVLAGVVF